MSKQEIQEINISEKELRSLNNFSICVVELDAHYWIESTIGKVVIFVRVKQGNRFRCVVKAVQLGEDEKSGRKNLVVFSLVRRED